jgi:hypothetical protein
MCTQDDLLCPGGEISANIRRAWRVLHRAICKLPNFRVVIWKVPRNLSLGAVTRSKSAHFDIPVMQVKGGKKEKA